jgi:D-alanyl-lipoteichoic acid acyltransferase DltB (MBOAT superfamily)
MVFNSLHFVWFFLVVYGAYRVIPVLGKLRPALSAVEGPHRAQNWLLLVASYYFYAAWDWRFLGLLLASTLVDYSCALAIERAAAPARRRALLFVSLAFNLTLLGFFKYFNFFADNLHAVFGALGWQVDFVTLRVLLPVGISFYTFVTMSYVIDVYRRETHATRNLLDFAVFVAFFPHLVAGPILRAATLLAQVQTPRRISREQMRDGAWLIAWGYFQKVFVADNLAALANAVFEPGTSHSGVNVLLGLYAFAFQIYGDFAGYSNIARGTSKLMGIELIENFRFPYLVRTPQEFWRNWHISLSTWLRDYLYIPLGGNRGTEWQTRRNLFATMVLGGLWHGAAWTFVVWGVYQGALLIAYRAAAGRRAFAQLFESPSALARVVLWAVMFHLTCYGWLIFRSRSAGQVTALTTSLLTNFAPASIDGPRLLIPLLMYTTPLLLVHACEAWFDDGLIVPKLPVGVRYCLYAATLYLTLLFGNFGGAEFIYFQF